MISSHVGQRWCITQLWRRQAATQEKGLSMMRSMRMETLLTDIVEQKPRANGVKKKRVVASSDEESDASPPVKVRRVSMHTFPIKTLLTCRFRNSEACFQAVQACHRRL